MKLTIASLILSAAALYAADLPVRQVVLYKHGVGFFERSGRLGPGESARLDFTATEMNDVLKSLTIGEKGGGKISGLRYDSMDPLSHSLESFPFRIGNAASLAVLDAVAQMSSDFESRQVLVALAQAMPPDAAVLQRYREVASGLSDFERSQAERAMPGVAG